MKVRVKVHISAGVDFNMEAESIRALIRDIESGTDKSPEELDTFVSQLIVKGGGQDTIKLLERWQENGASQSEIIAYLERALEEAEAAEENPGSEEYGDDDDFKNPAERDLVHSVLSTQEGAMMAVLFAPVSLAIIAGYLTYKAGPAPLKLAKKKWEESGRNEESMVNKAKGVVESAKAKAKKYAGGMKEKVKKVPSKVKETIKKIKKGPRGGEYYESESGEKVYV